MKKMTALAVVLILAALCIGACSDSTAPITDPAVDLTLRTTIENSGGESYVRAEFTVKNMGDITAHYPMICSDLGFITLRDEAGHQLTLHPTGLIDLCPPSFDNLGAGESIHHGLDLIWAWDGAGTEYRIPPGKYTVKAAFTYYLGTNDKPHHLKEELLVAFE